VVDETRESWVSLASREGITEEEISSVLEHFENELSRIGERAYAEPEDAYSSLITAVILFNRVLALRLPKLPDIESKIKNWINHVRSTVEKIAKGLASKFKVTGYSVGVGFPLGISVSVSFSI